MHKFIPLLPMTWAQSACERKVRECGRSADERECVCVCVIKRKIELVVGMGAREREKEKERGREREREWEGERNSDQTGVFERQRGAGE